MKKVVELQHKVADYLIPSGWRDKLRFFLLSRDFENLLDKLMELIQSGERFTPTLKTAFRAFNECHTDKLKVVIFNDNPYCGFTKDGKTRADGLAFSCRNNDEIEEDLLYLLKSIDNSSKDSYEKDLKPWANQGILLLNTSMTIGRTHKDTHHDIWNELMSYLCDTLNTGHKNLSIVFIGEKSQELMSLFDEDDHLLIAMENPWRSEQWTKRNIFREINEYLKNHSLETINW